MHKKNIFTAGKPITKESKVLIMLHGRGANAEDILSLSDYLAVKDFSLVAPQATNHSWYPFSFMSKPIQNEPWLSSALALVDELVNEILEQGVAAERLYFTGFSQGACLTLEYITRHAKKYGGVAAFTGGLIGDQLYLENYSGDFKQTPVFIGTSEPDPHVPAHRVHETEEALTKMNAKVNLKVYKNMGHMINEDEIRLANEWVFF